MACRLALVVAVAVATLTLAGCKKPANEQDTLLQEAREAGDAVPAGNTPATAAPVASLHQVPDEPAVVEPPPATFAGNYQGPISCQGCAGGTATLTLNVDGSYTVKRSGSNPGSTGNWTSEEGGKRLRLDPIRKEDGSQLWAVSTKDTLTRLDDDGTPLARNATPDVLTRAH